MVAQGAMTPGVAGIGEFPKNFDVPALEDRRMRAAARVFAVVAIVSTLVLVAQAGLLVALEPAKRGVPQPAVIDPVSGRILGVQAAEPVLDGAAAYVERLVVDFVRDRNRIVQDREEMTRLWSPTGPLALALGGEFAPLAKAKQAEILGVLNSGGERRVELGAVRTLALGSAYEVVFELVTFDRDGREVGRETRSAVLEIGFDPAKGGDPMLINPLGFQVVAYTEVDHSEGVEATR